MASPPAPPPATPSEAAANLFAIAVVESEAGIISQANEPMLSLTGYSRDELVGQPLDILVPERFREVHREHVRSFSSRPGPRPMGPDRQVTLRHKFGRDIDVWVGLSPVAGAGTVAVVLPRKFTSSESYDGRERRKHPR